MKTCYFCGKFSKVILPINVDNKQYDACARCVTKIYKERRIAVEKIDKTWINKTNEN